MGIIFSMFPSENNRNDNNVDRNPPLWGLLTGFGHDWPDRDRRVRGDVDKVLPQHQQDVRTSLCVSEMAVLATTHKAVTKKAKGQDHRWDPLFFLEWFGVKHQHPSPAKSKTKFPPQEKKCISLPLKNVNEWDTGILPCGQARMGAKTADTDVVPREVSRLPALGLAWRGGLGCKLLGEGSFGSVYLIPASRVAVKVISKRRIKSQVQMDNLLRERNALRQANHPYIVSFFGATQDEESLFLSLEHCPGRDLFYVLHEHGTLPESVTRLFAGEIALALEHLRHMKCAHRDIKPENILIDAQGHAKLCDFGLCTHLVKDELRGAVSLCGTPPWPSRCINQSIDWWQLHGDIYLQLWLYLCIWLEEYHECLLSTSHRKPHVQVRALWGGIWWTSRPCP
ncbi:unnamed protein product [Discosporangium mesarthrocarpum]